MEPTRWRFRTDDKAAGRTVLEMPAIDVQRGGESNYSVAEVDRSCLLPSRIHFPKSTSKQSGFERETAVDRLTPSLSAQLRATPLSTVVRAAENPA